MILLTGIWGVRANRPTSGSNQWCHRAAFRRFTRDKCAVNIGTRFMNLTLTRQCWCFESNRRQHGRRVIAECHCARHSVLGCLLQRTARNNKRHSFRRPAGRRVFYPVVCGTCQVLHRRHGLDRAQGSYLLASGGKYVSVAWCVSFTRLKVMHIR